MCGSLTYFEIHGKSLLTECFIETGTYHGYTTQIAIDQGFPLAKSIEVCERNYRIAVEKFANEPRVKLFLGSSRMWLPVIIQPELHTTFFLDGHYQGGPMDEQDDVTQCPLLDELSVILSAPWKTKPFIIIDDSRMYTGAEEHTPERLAEMKFIPEQWPRLPQIENALHGYEIIDHDDRLFCLPKN
jgi:hypothetical protein